MNRQEAFQGGFQAVPMRDFPHLCVIRDQTGNVVATIQKELAPAFCAYPELLEASRSLFEKLADRHKQWGPNSPLANLDRVLKRINGQP